MIKIGVITFHSAENSGAALQCVALQMALRKLGATPFVIDYQPKYMKEQYSIFINPFKMAKKCTGLNKIKTILAYTRQNLFFKRKLDRKKKFNAFRKNYMILSERFESLEELRENPPVADVYISGSDQVWNSSLTGGSLDPAFFLDFGNDNIRKYSYAISIGKELNSDLVSQFVRESSNLKCLSFREKSVSDEFKSLNISKKIIQSADPTLLIDKKDWCQFISKAPFKSKYLLVYGLEKNDNFKQVLRVLNKKYPGRLIVDISQANLGLEKTDVRKVGFTPDEFLNLIWHAECILTNSFHCSVFSTIFHKNFIVIPHKKSNTRINDLLSSLELKDRLFDGSEKIYNFDLDWEEVDRRIESYRFSSMEYLRQLIKEQRVSK